MTYAPAAVCLHDVLVLCCSVPVQCVFVCVCMSHYGNIGKLQLTSVKMCS